MRTSRTAYGNPLNAERLRVAIESNLAPEAFNARTRQCDCVVGYAWYAPSAQ